MAAADTGNNDITANGVSVVKVKYETHLEKNTIHSGEDNLNNASLHSSKSTQQERHQTQY